MDYVIGQILSIIAMTLMVISFQMKSNKLLFVLQIISCIGFATSYLLLGFIDACFLNILALLRCALFLIKKLKGNILVLILLEISFIVCTIFTYQSVFSILILIAQMAGTFSMWTNNGKVIRFLNLFITCPFWLINNIHAFSIGGIICESFNIISIIVALFRYRKTGFKD